MKKYLALIYVGNVGTSWAYGQAIKSAAKKAAAICRKDWGSAYTLPSQLKVCVYDVSDELDWHVDYEGMHFAGVDNVVKPTEIVVV